VQPIEVELGDLRRGDRIGLRAPPGRADELRNKQLMEVRIPLIELVDRLLEDLQGISNPIREAEGAAQLECDGAAPRRLGEEVKAGTQMVGRSGPVRPPLGKAKLDEHLCTRFRVGLLLERTGQILDRGIGCALG
jgi:hypothetical protein